MFSESDVIVVQGQLLYVRKCSSNLIHDEQALVVYVSNSIAITLLET